MQPNRPNQGAQERAGQPNRASWGAQERTEHPNRASEGARGSQIEPFEARSSQQGRQGQPDRAKSKPDRASQGGPGRWTCRPSPRANPKIARPSSNFVIDYTIPRLISHGGVQSIESALGHWAYAHAGNDRDLDTTDTQHLVARHSERVGVTMGGWNGWCCPGAWQ